ncbi:DUF3426 domain-containing protein [Pseudomonas mucidolens]|uniref:MJ0042 family finger-like domain-containing protein n=1 Tax=Pseudomonas mucidolens TaxID=46679 RepID=A0A1H2NKV6_9PSED|nr:DUF3426 domain-containing protein [Pseudomonas mucidolens]SDV05958.1 MJ0042 family finger-like domain-containing protein [Pseudomonas mucidolens]SQH31690.1 MJ0042 family finger-like domain-containing protein [Pseudomonas mucidolens]
MTDSFVTQCPHCQTRFRVNHAQLNVARGVVRCGSCLQVFSAARQLLEQRAQASEAPVQEAPAADAPPRAISQQQWNAEVLDLDNLDLDEELARLERREIKHAQPQDADRRQPGAERRQKDEVLSASRDTAKAEEQRWAASLFSDQPDEPAEPFDAADDGPELAPVPPGKPKRTEPSMSFDSLEPDDEPPFHAHSHDDDVDPPAPAISAEPDAPQAEPEEPQPARKRPRATTSAHDEMLQGLEDDPLHLYTGKRPASLGRRLLWLTLVLLAAAALGGQYIAYQFDELARQDNYRSWFQELCPTLGCTVPSRVDVAHIKSSNLVVRSHPEFAGALVVDAIIYNRATFSQPFPLLELRFADLNGRMIASRRFKPAEYLSGELAGQTEMPSQTPIHIALDILDPGNRAVNYSLSFHSPE